MSDETLDDICKECDSTFQAFLQQMATHNMEQMAELGANPKVICPGCL